MVFEASPTGPGKGESLMQEHGKALEADLLHTKQIGGAAAPLPHEAKAGGPVLPIASESTTASGYVLQ